MRAILTGTVLCLTAGTFYVAQHVSNSNTEAAARERHTAFQAQEEQTAALKNQSAALASEIEGLKSNEGALRGQISSLKSNVETLNKERDELATLLDQAKQEAKANKERVGELKAKYDEVMQMASTHQDALAQKDAELAALQSRADDLTAQIASVPEATDETEHDAEIAALSDILQKREETIAVLKEDIAVLKAAQEEATGAVVDTTAVYEDLAAAQEQIEILTLAADEQAKAADTRVAKLTKALSARDESIDGLKTELRTKEAAWVAKEEEHVAALEAAKASNFQMTSLEKALVCMNRAAGILDENQISFATGTAAISDGSVATLASLGELVRTCQTDELLIEIGGHTDSFGAAADNQALSEARAASVKDYLVENGIRESSLTVVGFGETNPIADNGTKEGRAANRRITFTWREVATLAVDG